MEKGFEAVERKDTNGMAITQVVDLGFLQTVEMPLWCSVVGKTLKKTKGMKHIMRRRKRLQEIRLMASAVAAALTRGCLSTTRDVAEKMRRD